MRNKSDLRMKKEYKIDWKNRRKWHRDNRAQKFQALGNRRERLRTCAAILIYDRDDNDEEEY